MPYRHYVAVLILLFVAIEVGNAVAQDRSTPIAMYRTRRDRAMQEAADAILLVRSRPTTMWPNEDGFRQEPAFYYLTGLGNAVGALLAMDSRRHETWLFVPESGRLPGFGSL